VHPDDRGWLTELFHRDEFAGAGLPGELAQVNLTGSRKGVVRGLHYQLAPPQGKLVRVVVGEVFDVAVDLRRSSPAFGRWAGFRMRAGDGRSLWLPPGFAHGFLVSSDWAEVLYVVTATRDAASERAVRWDDPTLGIDWPLVGPPVLSDRDRDAVPFTRADTFP
jgi:dTDP-4-dehydrorhamnose 3,5-epimerase